MELVALERSLYSFVSVGIAFDPTQLQLEFGAPLGGLGTGFNLGIPICPVKLDLEVLETVFEFLDQSMWRFVHDPSPRRWPILMFTPHSDATRSARARGESVAPREGGVPRS